jgi:hypothetical protein
VQSKLPLLHHSTPEIEGVRTPSPTTIAVAVITTNSSDTCTHMTAAHTSCHSLHMQAVGFLGTTASLTWHQPVQQHAPLRYKLLLPNCDPTATPPPAVVHRTCRPLLRM